jgi:hypothetical protein
VEAFREYFDHLKPDGYIAITRWEFARPREALRVVAQAMRALGGRAVPSFVTDARQNDFTKNFIIVVEGDFNQDGRPVTVLAKKSPFTPEEQSAVLQHLESQPKLHAIYLPYSDSAPKVEQAAAFRRLIESGNPEQFAASYPFNVTPVYDDAPFFFFTLKPSQILGAGTEHGIDWKVNMGVAVLLMLVLISAIAVALFLIVPLLFSAHARQGAKWMPLIYFVAIGLGYIAVEITLIQRLVLFLGHPIYAMTVVVFLMLLSSGMGSMLSRRMFKDARRVKAAFVAVVVILVTYYFALSPLLHALIGLDQSVKVVIAALLIIPLGFAMGMPFPSGLRMLGEARGEDNLIEWAWAMNAASSVLGSVLSMTLAIQFGLGVTLICGALAYVVGWAMTSKVAAMA